MEKISLCLPTFHCYGHKAACQVITNTLLLYFHIAVFQILFGPLRCRGIGLSDGEVMERLWSYLRRFNRMTKEMRPSHRVDVLAHALVYYGIQKKEKMGNLLLSTNPAHKMLVTSLFTACSSVTCNEMEEG